MRFTFETSPYLKDIIESFSQICSKIRSSTAGLTIPMKIPSNENLLAANQAPSMYFIAEGALTLSVEGRDLMLFEEGDLVLTTSNSPQSNLSLSGQFATRLERLDISSQMKSPELSNLMIELAGLQQEIFMQLLSHFHHGEKNIQPNLKRVSAGEVIIKEGELSDLVYTLVEGHATVSKEGEVVGEVRADELIGVIGALCNIPRIATVTASKNSILLSLRKQDFSELLSLRPHTVIKLIEDFSRIIASNNQEILILKKQISSQEN